MVEPEQPQPAPDPLPLFPLGAVVFPGAQVPLRVFEDRYTALVRHLRALPDPADRVFGTVAIREGYEVGDHGAQSLYRTGTRLQLTEVEEAEDGTFVVVAVGRDRFRMDGLDTTGDFPAGIVEPVADAVDDPAEADAAAADARAVFTAYRAALLAWRDDPVDGPLPKDPAWLSWALSAAAPLPMAEQQALLEADGAAERLRSVTRLLREELQAMNVVPSLPASELARTRWSPN